MKHNPAYTTSVLLALLNIYKDNDQKKEYILRYIQHMINNI